MRKVTIYFCGALSALLLCGAAPSGVELAVTPADLSVSVPLCAYTAELDGELLSPSLAVENLGASPILAVEHQPLDQPFTLHSLPASVLAGEKAELAIQGTAGTINRARKLQTHFMIKTGV